jgi:lipopolysaccharide/colanic/teichoic acid biosynthesis glycosyltransferase
MRSVTASSGPRPAFGRETSGRGGIGGQTTSQSGLPLKLATGRPFVLRGTGALFARLVAKRLIDIIVSVVALVLLSPLLLCIAATIRLGDGGSILFRQQREGRSGRLFQLLKFRTWREDDCDASGISQPSDDDPRLTPIGRVLRRTSLDELPQLLNVLRGEMSLVGPRPHVPGMRAGGTSYRQLVPYYAQRLQMKPGLTGWAQVNGLRGPTGDPWLARRRIDHDLAYIQNFSLRLDLKILARTLFGGFLMSPEKVRTRRMFR